MKPVITRDETMLKKTDEEIFYSDFKSMWYSMNTKQDSTTKIYNQKIKICLDDIYHLNDIVISKLKQYHNQGLIVSVNVNYANRNSVQFGSWNEFEKCQFRDSNAIRSITITWNFSCMLPDLSLPQQHSLMVKLTNGITPEEMLNLIISGNVENVEEIDKDFFPIVARVDFIDRLLGDELLNLVGNWVDGLTKVHQEKNKFILLLKKHKRKVAYSINYLITVLSVVFSVKILNKIINSYDIMMLGEMSKQQMNNIINTIVVLSSIVFLTNKIFYLIAQYVFNKLKEYDNNHIFCITRGDKNKQNKLAKEEKLREKKIIFNVVLTVILNIICGIITAIIT